MPQSMYELAKAILSAQRIREDSFIKAGYRKSNFNAAAEATIQEPQMTIPVYLLNETAWNDAQDWAKSIIEDEKGG